MDHVSSLFPAVILTGLLAWFYASCGKLPAVESRVRGMQLAVLAVAVWKLGRKALGNVPNGRFALFVPGAVLYGFGETRSLLVGGVLGGVFLVPAGPAGRDGRGTAASFVPILFLQTPAAGAPTGGAVSFSKPFLLSLKVEPVLYGSGYVLVAFLESDLVERHGWLTQAELLDAIAVGQFTPGPVLSTVTFAGYLLSCVLGAVLANLGIFLPSFLNVLALNPLMPRLRDSQWAGRFLDAVKALAVSLMWSRPASNRPRSTRPRQSWSSWQAWWPWSGSASARCGWSSAASSSPGAPLVF